MNIQALLTATGAIALLCQTAMADIGMPRAAVPGSVRQELLEDCDLMATNVVRAVFEGKQEPGANQPVGSASAVFRVIEHLAHRRYVRYGDGVLPEGSLVTVPLDSSVQGQPHSVSEEIAALKPGEEVIMKIDHLYIFADPQGIHARPCTKIVRRTDPAAQPATSAPAPYTSAAPLQAAPQQPVSESFSTQVSFRPDGKGGMIQERIDIRTQYNPATGQTTTRMFINGQEVDPNTRQPLLQTVPTPTPAPAAAPAPAPAPTPAPAPGN